MNKNAGFTLIELLVVVLIIGILSSVALPQYQRTVLKSRAAEAWSTLGAIQTAVAAYCLENPEKQYVSFDSIRDSLPIEISDSKNFTYSGVTACGDSNYVNPIMMAASYSKGSVSFVLGNNRFGQRVCHGTSCKDLGFTQEGESGSSGGQCLCGGAMPGGNWVSPCYYMD